ARPVQRRVQEVPRAVTGEHPPGPVGAVGGRGQADDDDRGVRVAEGRDRLAPVLLVPEGGPLLPGHLLPPLHQAGARPAGDHLLLQPAELLVHPPEGRRRGLDGPPRATATVAGVPRRTRTKPTLVLLVRHGATPTTGSRLPGRAPGLHLSDTGRAQAEEAARRIAALAE